ncbi:hypothetical protein F5Y14DRAFT_462055 [Nemania sp. NC0429]|nr:hypothetical protein F5Y14DRAFT_462055 [Nemania sp. NC0429]
MTKINRNISNGTCWANVNVALEDEYIPCGNVADGNSYACCHYGDNCLSSNACYHNRFGVTYLAGCTTQDFTGPACQNKGRFYDQGWVGLVRCDPDQTSWAGCPEKDGVVGSSPPTSNCKCSKDTVLFQDNPMLANIASLPLSLGGTISWFPGHTPTGTPDTTSTTSHRETQSTTISTASSSDSPAESTTLPTPTSSTTTPPVAGLSVGEKAGIGIGSAFGAIIIGCLIAIAVILQRRKAKKKEAPGPQPTVIPPIEPDPTQHQHEPNLPGSPLFNGYKAELPADEPRSASTMAPSSIHSSPGPVPSPHLSPPLHQVQYLPYRPGVYGDNRYSTISEMSSGTHGGYSESLVSTLSPAPPSAATERPKAGPGQPDTIHEVQG